MSERGCRGDATRPWLLGRNSAATVPPSFPPCLRPSPPGPRSPRGRDSHGPIRATGLGSGRGGGLAAVLRELRGAAALGRAGTRTHSRCGAAGVAVERGGEGQADHLGPAPTACPGERGAPCRAPPDLGRFVTEAKPLGGGSGSVPFCEASSL
ncbi:acetylcholinesterase collagenic tail peptide-like isoform X1 [Chiroxiphia lanceolata]|uniref:acetylcholinesterase collagenic tail peptide-like isoform X1 n=2 Tax=Chiroxiphia lanceolata TaxID=296741 RepID=UPI0013CF265A|nr:acetylcholinesterase collagenic tail peptide-like isoform X1 [Chiroxiphia lanceolata]